MKGGAHGQHDRALCAAFTGCLGRAFDRGSMTGNYDLFRGINIGRRANLALTAMLFDGELDVMIAYRQGPLQHARCRLDDFADDRRLIRAR